ASCSSSRRHEARPAARPRRGCRRARWLGEPGADPLRVARPDLRDPEGHVGAPHVGRPGGDPAEGDPPDARRPRRARAPEPRRRAADLRAHADDARPELPAALRARVELSVRMHRACERADDGHRGAVPGDAVGAPVVAGAGALDVAKLKQALPSLAALVALVAVWWAAVVATGSVIFPTPGQVVSGAAELVRDGTLFAHI